VWALLVGGPALLIAAHTWIVQMAPTIEVAQQGPTSYNPFSARFLVTNVGPRPLQHVGLSCLVNRGHVGGVTLIAVRIAGGSGTVASVPKLEPHQGVDVLCSIGVGRGVPVKEADIGIAVAYRYWPNLQLGRWSLYPSRLCFRFSLHPDEEGHPIWLQQPGGAACT